MYSLNRYFDTVNTTAMVMAIIAVSFIGTYFINVLRHKADKPSKFGFVVVLITLIFFCIVDFKGTFECTKYALDYPNAKALKFEVVEGSYEQKTVIRESMLHSFFRQIPSSHGHTSDAPDAIVRDKVNGVWLNSSISDNQFGFDGSTVGHGRYRVYYLKYTKIIARVEKLNK